LRVSAAVAIDGPGDLAAMIGPDAKTCDRPVIAPLDGRHAFQASRTLQASVAHRASATRAAVISRVVKGLVGWGGKRSSRPAIARGDKAEILAVPNGGHFDIITPGTKAWGEVEGFILDHAFGEAAHTP
jgi:hypothetical protein